MTDEIIQVFKTWWDEASLNARLKHKGAVCISTVNASGFPEGRFVDLKEVTERGFVFCSRFDSAKGVSLRENPKVGMTAWWDHVEKQVRVKGTVEIVPDSDADKYWQTRSRDAQLASWASHQSAELKHKSKLKEKLDQVRKDFANQPIPRLKNWGGYLIIPVSIEFLAFKQNRLHERVLYSKTVNGWEKTLLQP